MLPVLLLTSLAARAADPAPRVFPYDVATKTLPNGLVVDVVPMPSPGVVAYYTWMAVGSRDEVDAGRTGFAHFFEHLSFYGSEKVGGEAREREILRLGDDENAWTWFDETVYHHTVSTAGLPHLVELEADRFQHLHLTEDDVRKEAGAVYGEFRKNQADPENALSDELYAAAFGTHTYGHDTMGYEADIQAFPKNFAYARAFFDRFYRPENATILVVGDVKPDDVFAMVEGAYGSWSRGTTARPAIPAEPPQKGVRRKQVDWPVETAPRLVMGWKIPASRPDDPEVSDLELAAELLLSPVGPLQRRLVEDEGVAYEVTGGRDAFVDPGLLRVEVVCKDPAGLARAEAVVREEVAKLAAGVDGPTLDRTRSHARYAFLSNLDDPAAVADALGWAIRRGGTPDAVDRFYAVYDHRTSADVAATVKKYLADDGLTVVTMTGPKEAK